MDLFFKDEASFKKSLQSIFKGYRTVSPKMKRNLNDLGFNFVRNGNHYVLVYFLNNQKFTFAISKTVSEGKSGMNIASKIYRTLKIASEK